MKGYNQSLNIWQRIDTTHHQLWRNDRFTVDIEFFSEVSTFLNQDTLVFFIFVGKIVISFLDVKSISPVLHMKTCCILRK